MPLLPDSSSPVTCYAALTAASRGRNGAMAGAEMLYTTKPVYLIPGFSTAAHASIRALQGAGHQIEEVMISLGGKLSL